MTFQCTSNSSQARSGNESRIIVNSTASTSTTTPPAMGGKKKNATFQSLSISTSSHHFSECQFNPRTHGNNNHNRNKNKSNIMKGKNTADTFDTSGNIHDPVDSHEKHKIHSDPPECSHTCSLSSLSSLSSSLPICGDDFILAPSLLRTHGSFGEVTAAKHKV